MEDLLFGEGWLGELLREPTVSSRLKDEVRGVLIREGGEGGKGWSDRWEEVNRLLEKGEVGSALKWAMGSLREVVEALQGLEEARGLLGKSFSPFLIREREIRAVLHPREDMEELIRTGDDLEAVLALELLNDVRRLLASWGANTWGEEPIELMPRLEGDLEELRRMQAELRGMEDTLEEDLEAEIRMADRFAEVATRFARDLFQLHLLNARNPEVRMRFDLLWKQVEQLLEEDNPAAAVQEAYSLLEEAFQTVGLGGGDLLEMVDILYDVFSDPERLRRAVDSPTAARRDRDVFFTSGREREFVEVIRDALVDMGLLSSPI